MPGISGESNGAICERTDGGARARALAGNPRGGKRVLSVFYWFHRRNYLAFSLSPALREANHSFHTHKKRDLARHLTLLLHRARESGPTHTVRASYFSRPTSYVRHTHEQQHSWKIEVLRIIYSA